MNWKYDVRVDTSKIDKILAQVANPREVLDEIADETVRKIKANIQYQHVIDTGALFNSINQESTDSGFIVQDGVEYGIYNEFGTHKMSPRPFFVPALEEIGKLFLDLFSKVFK